MGQLCTSKLDPVGSVQMPRSAAVVKSGLQIDDAEVLGPSTQATEWPAHCWNLDSTTLCFELLCIGVG